MANTTDQLTAEQLASMPGHGKRCELVDGVLHMLSPAGGRHGRIAGKLFLRVGNHVERHKLGETFAAETGFLIQQNPDTVRAPDVSFVSYARLSGFADYPGYLPLAPDIVAEVVSLHDNSSAVEAKAAQWRIPWCYWRPMLAACRRIASRPPAAVPNSRSKCRTVSVQ